MPNRARATDERLLNSWQRTWRAIGARGDGVSVFLMLVDQYAEEHRKYHTCQHLHECLATLDGVIHLCERPDEVAAALWFHDAFCDLHAKDNEERSAYWARTALQSAGVSHDAAAQVHEMVMATMHTGAPVQGDVAIALDVDLAILGASPRRFLESQDQLREEYWFEDDATYRRRRRQVLTRFLSWPSVYSTAHFKRLLEASAQRNLNRSLVALG